MVDFIISIVVILIAITITITSIIITTILTLPRANLPWCHLAQTDRLLYRAAQHLAPEMISVVINIFIMIIDFDGYDD